jgi:hypothetical protein
VSIRQADTYISRAQQLLKTDFEGQREEILNQVNALRMTAIKQGLKRGNLQTVAHLLDSVARSFGELDPATNDALAVPQISIRIEE